MESNKFIISLLVNNHYGVLTRISGLFSKRGFNIDSLTVGVTQNPAISRMTITSRGDDYVKNQMVQQLLKLVDVKTAELMDMDKIVVRELLIVKIALDSHSRIEVMEAVQVFRAKVVDFSTSSLSVEITGEVSKLNAFLDYVRPYGIIEMSRTGVTAIGRSSYILNTTNQEE